MNAKKLDALFRELEQVQSEGEASEQMDAMVPDAKALPESSEKKRTLGLGLAVVARIIRNMNGQMRLKSEEGKGSRFVIQFPFELPDSEPKQVVLEAASEHSVGSVTPLAEAPTTPSTPPSTGERTLIERGSAARRGSAEPRPQRTLSRQNSGGSDHSHRSLGSIKSGKSAMSFSSQRSGKSEADRLIDAISEPHQVSGHSHSSLGRSGSGGSGGLSLSRPSLEKRHTTGVDATGSPVRSRAASHDVSRVPPFQREQKVSKPGESAVEGQGQPIHAIRVPDDVILSPGGTEVNVASANADGLGYKDHSALPEKADEPATADHMRVLVAEDDPVNSRIIKKRLEKLGHDVFLTVNGEECSGTYSDKSGYFDIILMDMQVSFRCISAAKRDCTNA